MITDIPYPIFLLIVEYLYTDTVTNLSDISSETRKMLEKGIFHFLFALLSISLHMLVHTNSCCGVGIGATC